MQGEVPTAWAIVNPDEPYEAITLRIVGTGHNLPDEPGRFLGTFQMQGGALVFHAFQPVQ